MLIMADIGAATAAALVDEVRRKGDRISDADSLKKALKAEIRSLLQPPPAPAPPPVKPRVIMVVGVNGVGKTTTIGKLAARAKQEGRQVLVAAADTFRAAAIEQLAVWTRRAGVELVRHKPNADPAAVAFDGVAAAMARGIDVVFIDTAGRLHTNVNLMEELKKIRRTIAKQLPGAPHEVLLVMDATTGQNGLNQARLFHEALGVTGIALTKLDGTAKGGIVVSICQGLGLPLRYVGVGEQIQDLQPFDPAAFAEALF
jgi:fused signal recognition particle receptor